MISLQNFIRAVEDNAARVKVYKQPGDGSNGECDCIGLIIGAKRLAGGSWTGTHGSNYAFRYEMQDTGVINSADDLFIGEIVYKAREPEDEYYDLKDKYKPGGKSYTGDIRDYYHVGVVTDISPLEITHCTSPGPIQRDRKLGKWHYGGRLKGVDYGNITTPNTTGGNEDMSEIKIKIAYVYGGSLDSGINMRATASTKAKLVDVIPQNAMIELLVEGAEWCKVKYAGKTGYVMAKFVHLETEENEPIEEDTMVPDNALEEILARLDAIEEQLEDMEERLHDLENEVGFG